MTGSATRAHGEVISITGVSGTARGASFQSLYVLDLSVHMLGKKFTFQWSSGSTIALLAQPPPEP